MGELAPNLGMEGGDLLLEVPLGLLLLLQLLLEGVLLILHLLQLRAQAQLLPVLLLQQLLLRGHAVSGPRGPHTLKGRDELVPRFGGQPAKTWRGGGRTQRACRRRGGPSVPGEQRPVHYGRGHGSSSMSGAAGPAATLTCVSCSWDSRAEKSLESLLDLLSDWVRRPVTLSSSTCVQTGDKGP